MQLPDDQIKAFLDAAPDAMVVVDAHGTISFVNTQTEALFGYSRNELVGQPIEVLLPERFRGVHGAHRDGYFASPKPRPMGAGLDLFGLRKDGTEFPAEISLSPVQTAAGLFVTSAIRDSTERKAVEQNLIKAREEAERANRAKSGFLAAASHDLRQPLQTLTLLNKVLSRTVPAKAKAAVAVESQAQALASMAKLLNSLLDISKLESGAIKPDISEVSVRGIFARLRDEFAAIAQSKGLELIVEGGAEEVVLSDPTLLGQIVQNLVSNAIRYTQRGRVSLRSLALGDIVRIEVLDTGVGIPPSEIEMIFEEFYQAPRSPEMGREGLGLGLSIVRRIADLLDHSLEVTSAVDRGSCFAISVPRAESIEPSAEPSRAAGYEGPVSSALVVIIDDDAAVGRATAMLLETAGLEVVEATGSALSIERLRARDAMPSLLICDYHIGPSETGIDAIEAVRSFAGVELPAILISGDTSSAMLEAPWTTGRCRLLSKPVDADELLGLVAELIGSSAAPPARAS